MARSPTGRSIQFLNWIVARLGAMIAGGVATSTRVEESTNGCRGTETGRVSGDRSVIARRPGPKFAQARGGDRRDAIASWPNHYAALKAAGLFEAGVPRVRRRRPCRRDLAVILRGWRGHCGSTALAFAMHSHQVAVPAWRWLHQQAPAEALLKRVAAEDLVILSSGGSDWMAGAGQAEKVEGGSEITGRKAFSSGAPAGNLLITSAVCREPGRRADRAALRRADHLADVRIFPDWSTLGIRATGSHDVMLDGQLVPEAAIALRAGRREASGVPHHRHDRLPPDLFGLSGRGGKGPRPRAGTGAQARRIRMWPSWRVGWRPPSRRRAGVGAAMLAAAAASPPARRTPRERSAASAGPTPSPRSSGPWRRRAAQASIVRPDWSGGSATSRARASIPCSTGRKRLCGRIALGQPVDRVLKIGRVAENARGVVIGG